MYELFLEEQGTRGIDFSLFNLQQFEIQVSHGCE